MTGCGDEEGVEQRTQGSALPAVSNHVQEEFHVEKQEKQQQQGHHQQQRDELQQQVTAKHHYPAEVVTTLPVSRVAVPVDSSGVVADPNLLLHRVVVGAGIRVEAAPSAAPDDQNSGTPVANGVVATGMSKFFSLQYVKK